MRIQKKLLERIDEFVDRLRETRNVKRETGVLIKFHVSGFKFHEAVIVIPYNRATIAIH